MNSTKVDSLGAKQKKTDKIINELWELTIPAAVRVSSIFKGRYPTVDKEDLRQSILLHFPRIVARFDPSRGVPFSKYVYFAYYRAGQDELRKLDPLGISYPQKQLYPFWRFVGDVCEDEYLAILLLSDGIDRLDKGLPMSVRTKD